MTKYDIGQLKKYLFPDVINLISAIWVTLIFLLLIQHTNDCFSIILVIFFIFLSFLGCINEIKNLNRLCLFFKTQKDSPLMTQVLKDFRSKQRLGLDSIRLGKNYIIGKQGASPFRYEEIERIYEFCNTLDGGTSLHSFVEPRRYMYVTTARGEQLLARIPYSHLSEKDFNLLFETIKSKNPNVQWVIMKRKSLGLEIEYEPYK